MVSRSRSMGNHLFYSFLVLLIIGILPGVSSAQEEARQEFKRLFEEKNS